MAIRFLEYLKHDEKFISMYVVQDNEEQDVLAFKVNLRDGEELITLSIENGSNGWQINPRETPAWIAEIQPLLIEQIESKVSERTLGSRNLDRTG